MSQEPLRRIVLFLDGTWNDNLGRTLPTNIVRMHEALKIGVAARARPQSAGAEAPLAEGSRAVGEGGRDVEYVVHYDPGVGTGVTDRLSGGAFGRGLDENIRQAYRFLSKHYREGDEIHAFGFSRGAYTVRSVVGYLFATGLLKSEACTTEREEQAWRHYRTSPQDRNCGDWHALKPFLHDPGKLTVKSVGVFDTVGALGIPTDLFRLYNSERYAFHNTDLSPLVEYSFHAMAIDEHRPTFEATPWRKPKFKEFPNAKVEQVWFPGAHADIGGGYSDWDKGQGGRADIAYDWMVRRLIDRVGLDFAPPGPRGPPAQRCDPREAIRSDIHRPWGILDKVRAQACRAINQVPPRKSRGVPLPQRGTKIVGLGRHEEPIGELMHISALGLLDDKTGVAWEKIERRHVYRPPNLVAVLPLVASSYRAWDAHAWTAWKPLSDALTDGALKPQTLYVVDWDGDIIPASPAEATGGATPVNLFAYLGDDPKRFGF